MSRAKPRSPRGFVLWHVLIDEDLIAIRIVQREARRSAGGFISAGGDRQATALERFLNVANVIEILEGVHVAIPAGVVGQDVLVERALVQADGAGVVLHDEE